MPNLRQIRLASVVVCAMLSTVAAQESSTGAKATLTITVNATGERMRITAPSSIVQMHVEVYASSGEKLFDQEIRGGNVFDWHLQDGQAQRLAPGAYVCVVTAKSISGKLTQKVGTVTVAEKSASVQAGSQQLSLQQTQAIGPVEADSSWTVAGENEPQTPTVIANDGKEGQMIRGRGALTFRIGNFFSGIDTEQMRLTEAGDLGIGTSQPQSKLDVAGIIRAERFVVVKRNLGNGDKTAAATQTTDGADAVQPLVAGTGTQNQIAKWTDNAGTLGDSGITEAAGGNVGIGTTSPGAKLEVGGTVLATGGFRDSGTAISRFENTFNALPTGAAGKAVEIGVESGTDGLIQTYDRTGGALIPLHFAGSKFYFTTGNVGIGTTSPNRTLTVEGNGLDVRSSAGYFVNLNYAYSSTVASLYALNNTGAIAPLSINPDGGNVGIGTTNPLSKLDVAGNINTSTQYNIGGSRVFTVSGPGVLGIGPLTNTFVGVDAGKSNIANANEDAGVYNSFFGTAAGQQNISGVRNSFFGSYAGFNHLHGENNSFFGTSTGANTTNGLNNSFFGTSAGFANTTGSENTFLGYSAGQSNIIADYNTAIGSYSDVSAGITNATAVGYKAKVTQSNSLVLGSINTVNGATADTNVGIGTTAPGYRLDVVGRSRIKQNAGQTGSTNTAGLWLFQNTPAADRAFVGMESDNSVGFFGGNGGGWGMIMNTQNGNVGIGTTGPLFKLQVLDQSNTGLRVQTNIAGGTVASFGGLGDFQIDTAGIPGGRLTVKENGFVGIGLNNPDRALVVNGAAAKPGGGSWDAFSDERLKTIKGNFTSGLKAVMQLQPLRYEYKPDNALGIRSSGEHIGFGAQAVQKIIPEAVTKNDAGYLLVNNDPILWTMLNAIKEQQKEVEAQQRLAQQQQDQIAALRTENTTLNARLQMIEQTLRKKPTSTNHRRR